MIFKRIHPCHKGHGFLIKKCKTNTKKHRFLENKYATIPPSILLEIINEIKNDATIYFDLKLKELE